MEKGRHGELLEWILSSPVQVVKKLEQNWWQRDETVQQDDGSGQTLLCHRIARRIALQNCSSPEQHKRRQNCRRHPAGKTPESISIKSNYISKQLNWTIHYLPSIVDQINASNIRKAGMLTQESHWRNEWRLITLFKATSCNLAKTIANVARQIDTEAMAPDLLKAYSAWRLVPLFDKNPGVRLIGKGEVKEEQSASLSRNVHHKISNSDRINNSA